jgi:hypothetical protein
MPRPAVSAAKAIEFEFEQGLFQGEQPKVRGLSVVRENSIRRGSEVWEDPDTGEKVVETFRVDDNFPYQRGCLD